MTVVDIVDNKIAILFVCVISATFLCCLPCCALCYIRVGAKQKVLVSGLPWFFFVFFCFFVFFSLFFSNTQTIELVREVSSHLNGGEGMIEIVSNGRVEHS